MTDQELKEFIEKTVREAVGEAKVSPQARTRIMQPTLDRWFKDEKGCITYSKMNEVIGDGPRTARLWELIRPICTMICGSKYTRDVNMKDSEFINDVADRICQLVYELRKEYLDSRK